MISIVPENGNEKKVLVIISISITRDMVIRSVVDTKNSTSSIRLKMIEILLSKCIAYYNKIPTPFLEEGRAHEMKNILLSY